MTRAATMSQSRELNDPMESLTRRPSNATPERTRLEAVHISLQGRYPLAIILALLGLIGGAVAGWMLPKPVYRSTATVQVKALQSTVLYRDFDSQQITQRYEQFRQTQMDTMQSEPVLRRAAKHSLIKPWPGFAEDDGYGPFARGVKIEGERGRENVMIHYDARDPELARAGANAISEAYLGYVRDQASTVERDRMDRLRRREQEILTSLERMRSDKLDTSARLGSESLAEVYAVKLKRIETLEHELDQVQLALHSMRDVAAVPDVAVSLQMLAASDPQIKNYLDQRFATERELARLSTTYGTNHHMVREQQNILARINDMINLALSGAKAQVQGTGPSVDYVRLVARERGIALAIERVRDEVAAVSDMQSRLNVMDTEEQQIRTRLADTRQRIDELTLESAGEDRISVLSAGSLPLRPFLDRRKHAAAALGMLGMVAGFGVVVLVGLLDPRIRSFDDARATIEGTPVLGMLPMLPEELGDSNAVATAAHCVHNIRTMLQVGPEGEERRVFSVTSAGPGSGKTSLTLAMGLSFAGAGSRTLLIDCDLVGGGLSRRVSAILPSEREHVLVREGLVTPWQFEQSLGAAELSGRSVVDVLIEAGYLEASQSEQARMLIRDASRGLLDVIRGVSLDEAVVETDVPNLSFLAVGRADEHDISRLSLKAIRRVLEAARAQYEHVIIDTGPTPGSLEATLVGAESDGVVMVVARGEDRLHAEQAVRHLKSFNARVVGMVFNRADPRDMEASGATSVSRRSVRPDLHESLSANDAQVKAASKFDPIGRAVASTSRSQPASPKASDTDEHDAT